MAQYKCHLWKSLINHISLKPVIRKHWKAGVPECHVARSWQSNVVGFRGRNAPPMGESGTKDSPTNREFPAHRRELRAQ
eukprot:scaffold223142_cov35-Attheya_sp.AAC.1